MKFKVQLDKSNSQGNLASPLQRKKQQLAIRDAMQKALEQIILEVYKESQILVPVKTGALKASGRITKATEAFENGIYDVNVEYGNDTDVDYAVYVHEDLTKFHQAPTQAKFLEIPLARNRERIVELLKSNIGKAWGSNNGIA
jgi:hypothetical protein